MAPELLGCELRPPWDDRWYGYNATGDCADAEPCEGDFSIVSVSDIDSIEYCESISGELTFDQQDWLASIDLPCLTSVGANLEIRDNAVLTSLDVPALTTTDDRLTISNNDALTSLSGFSGLTSVGSQLYIGDNDALTSLSGLSSLTSVGSDLDIVDNDCLSQAEAEAFASVDSGGTYVTGNGANYPCD